MPQSYQKAQNFAGPLGGLTPDGLQAIVIREGEMHSETLSRLLEINRRFYAEHAGDFAATRRRIQPGVRRVLQMLPAGGRWLDLGCGSGALAGEWIRAGRTGEYHGLDFSPGLLQEARSMLEMELLPPGLKVHFTLVDLADPDWLRAAGLGEKYDGLLAFAFLHHIPSTSARLALLRQARGLIPGGAWFALSVWQFQHSPRLMARVQPWESVGVDARYLDEGDTLLDWRQPGSKDGQTGLRYVHLFTRAELAALADQTGFTLLEEFESDGQGGRLGLYQIWRAV